MFSAGSTSRDGPEIQQSQKKETTIKISTQINIKKSESLVDVAIQSTVLGDSGREFQAVGPKTLNALSQSFVLVRGMKKSVVAAEHQRFHHKQVLMTLQNTQRTTIVI